MPGDSIPGGVGCSTGGGVDGFEPPLSLLPPPPQAVRARLAKSVRVQRGSMRETGECIASVYSQRAGAMQRELHSDGEGMQAKGRTGREVYLPIACLLGAEHALYRKCGHLRRYALIRHKFCLLKLLRVETPRCLDA